MFQYKMSSPCVSVFDTLQCYSATVLYLYDAGHIHLPVLLSFGELCQVSDAPLTSCLQPASLCGSELLT